MTDIFLITGFLGSGKTTFLQNQLRHNNIRVGVLMNEFGKIGIDGTLVEKTGMDLVELNNGSIFCSCLKGSFIDGILELLNKGLDAIYIESSGLADPANMLSIIDILRSKSSCDFNYCGAVCIVDSVYFFRALDMMTSVTNQILHSNLIIINKVDLVDTDTVNKIRSTILAMREGVPIIEVSHGKVVLTKELLTGESIGSLNTSNTEDNKPRTFNLKVKDGCSIADVRDIVELMAPYCHRIKGVVRLGDTTYKVDAVQDLIDIVVDTKEYELDNIVLISKIGNKLLTHYKKGVPQDISKRITITR